MTTKAEPSGVALGRQGLFAAREAAKKNGGGQKEKPRRRTRVVRRATAVTRSVSARRSRR